MSITKSVLYIPEMSYDPRVRVFRKKFEASGEFDGMEVDAYVIITDRYVVVCDTLLCPEDAAEMMQMVEGECAGRQILVVNSHADWDHSWGNAYFISEQSEHPIPIIAHDYCRTRLLSEEEQTGLADFQKRYSLFQNVTLVPPTLTFDQHFTIHGGDLTIELLPAPGHHPDHIAVWLPELRWLLAFDAAEVPFPILEDAPAVPSMFTTLEHFLRLQPARMLCSHGKTTSPALAKENLDYFREVERRSRQWLLEHTPTSEQLEHASEMLGFSFDEAIAHINAPTDRTFYSWVHDNNIRAMIKWLMSEKPENANRA